MDKEIYAIFTAGGSGVRMGSGTPKQFLELNGTPILQMTIENFVRALPQIRIVTVLPHSWIDEWKKLCLAHSFGYPQIIVEGGLTRFHSVRNALERIPDGAVVMIHDGVRPFAGEGLIRAIMEKMESCRAVVPVTPVTDTLKSLTRSAEGNLVPDGPDPDRSRIFGAQTPQVFLSEDIKEAYRQAYDVSFTDDASVARRKGIGIDYIQGERFNIKITTPEDMLLAGFILQKKRNGV